MKCPCCDKTNVDINDVCIECWWECSEVNKDNVYCNTNRMTLGQAKHNYSLLGVISRQFKVLKANTLQKYPEMIGDYFV